MTSLAASPTLAASTLGQQPPHRAHIVQRVVDLLKQLLALLTKAGSNNKATLAFIIVTMGILNNRLTNQRDYKRTNGIPGDRGIFPFVEEMINLALDVRGYYVKRFARYGPVVRARFLGYNVVSLADPQHVSWVLCNEDLFAARMFPSAMKMLEGFMLVQGGQEHRRNRALVVRALSDNQLKQNLKGIADKFTSELQLWQQKGEVEIYTALKRAIMKVMLEILFGNSNVKDEEVEVFLQDYITFGEGLASFPIELPFTGRGRGLAARRRLIKWLESVIEDRRKVAKEDSAKFRDLLQSMIDSPDPETGLTADTESIAKNALVIFLAALDTTASVVASSMKLLRDHPKALAKIRDECRSVWGSDPDAMAKMDQEEISARLNKLGYLDCLVQEALRYRSPVLATMREATQDVQIPGTDYIIPKGWFVSVAFTLPFLSDSSAFPEPEKFAPERFDANGKSAASSGFRGSFIPFGKGSHQCPGWRFAVAESKVVLSLLALQDNWPELVENSDNSSGGLLSSLLKGREYYAPALEVIGGTTWRFH